MEQYAASSFGGFRSPPAPTLYAAARSAVTADVVEWALITSFCLTFLCLLLAIPGVRSTKKQFLFFAKAFFALYFPLCILLSIFGFGWRSGVISTETAYKQFISETIHAKVGLHIGLYGVNITLKGTPVHQVNETINYNEHLPFGDEQGRLEFGPQGGELRQGFRASQLRGSPLPVLWIAEYLTLDGERIRWGRFYQEAGYYTALLLWTALSLWAVSMAATHWVFSESAWLITLTGLAHVVACITYSTVHARAGPVLVVPFEDATLTTSYGWAFFLVLFNGCFLAVAGLVVIIATHFFKFKVFRRRKNHQLPVPDPDESWDGGGADIIHPPQRRQSSILTSVSTTEFLKSGWNRKESLGEEGILDPNLICPVNNMPICNQGYCDDADVSIPMSSLETGPEPDRSQMTPLAEVASTHSDSGISGSSSGSPKKSLSRKNTPSPSPIASPPNPPNTLPPDGGMAVRPCSA